MRETFKALFLLVFGIVALVASYIGWLMYMPVTTTDVSARIWNACVVGQTLFQYGKPTHTSCDCLVNGLRITDENSSAISEQADILRQVILARFDAFWSGNVDEQGFPRFNTATHGKALPLVNRIVSLDNTCKVAASGP